MKQMDIGEFREFGYLQEANRQFFHPLGLALFVEVGDDGRMTLGGIQDDRDDPEGTIYAEGVIDPEKVKRVGWEQARRSLIRFGVLGYNIQPPFDDSADGAQALWELLMRVARRAINARDSNWSAAQLLKQLAQDYREAGLLTLAEDGELTGSDGRLLEQLASDEPHGGGWDPIDTVPK